MARRVVARGKPGPGQQSFGAVDPLRSGLPVGYQGGMTPPTLRGQPVEGGLVRPSVGRGGPIRLPAALGSGQGSPGAVEPYVRPHGGSTFEPRNWRWGSEEPAEGELISEEEYRRTFNPVGGPVESRQQPSEPPARVRWGMGAPPRPAGPRMWSLNAGPQPVGPYESPIGPRRAESVQMEDVQPDRSSSEDQRKVIEDIRQQWNTRRKEAALSSLAPIAESYMTPGAEAGQRFVGLGSHGIGSGGAMLGTQNMRVGEIDPTKFMQSRAAAQATRTRYDQAIGRYHWLRRREDQRFAGQQVAAQRRYQSNVSSANAADRPYFSGQGEPVPNRAQAEMAYRHYDIDPQTGRATRRAQPLP